MSIYTENLLKFTAITVIIVMVLVSIVLRYFECKKKRNNQPTIIDVDYPEFNNN